MHGGKKIQKNKAIRSGFVRPSLLTGTDTKAKFDKEFRDKNILVAKKEIKEKNWYAFVLSFLINARNGCEFLIESKRLDDNNKYLVISILYNFKHGLEVFLKAFTRFLNEKLDKSDYGHDTKALLESFKKNLKSKKRGVLSKEVDKLENFVEKYNEINFFENYIKESASVYDYENTFFKYPEHSARITVDYSKLSSQITRSDMKEIKDDIEEVIRISKKFKNILS